ncbi:hypothetical protein FRB96_003165 [Tulasnella sp. 330]|nr:hypothetical protein FRB96_003165 [Tulasnella sp. 330]KAG8884296.1 hypothetical protein FRB97_004560 [Tulasnella sp. 331]KAG8884800.1 hypothetical protein FRB98_002159 [Tulasnella sp. 332]
MAKSALSEKLAALQIRYDALSAGESSGSGSTSHNTSDSALDLTITTASKMISQPLIYTPPPPVQTIISDEFRSQLLQMATYYIPRCSYDINFGSMLALLDLPPDQQQQPALTNALMLLATWWGHNHLPPETPPAEYFVHQTRIHLNASLEDANGLLSHVAASALLSWWLMQNGRFVEGQFEVSTNARLAIGCGLHRIDEEAINGMVQYPLLNPSRAYGILGPPSCIDDLELRVNTFWIVYYCDKIAALMTGLPSAFDEHTSDPKLKISTVLPRPHGKYMATWSFNDFASIDDLMLSSQLVISNPVAPPLFRTPGPPSTSVSASLQAVTLALRATKLASHPPQSKSDAVTLRESLMTLNTALSRYTASIPILVPPHLLRGQPPPFAYGATTAQSAYFRVAEVTYATYVAFIKMHQAAEALKDFDPELRIEFGSSAAASSSRDKRLTAARAVAKIAEEVALELDRPDSIPNPKEGLCIVDAFFRTTAACVFIEHASDLRKTAAAAESGDIAIVATQLQSNLDDFNKILFGLRRTAQIFPVIESQLKELTKMMEEVSSAEEDL